MKPSHLILRLAAAVLSWLPFHATAYQQTPDCSFACGGSSQYSDCGSFAINFTPLYLQPNSSNLCYAAESVPLPLVSPHWKIHDIRPDYHFGFNVGIGYAIADNCSNMRLDWTHFTQKTQPLWLCRKKI